MSPHTLADDCRFFADSAERHGTPWSIGCAHVLRLAADALDAKACGVDGGQPTITPGESKPANTDSLPPSSDRGTR